MFDTETDFTDAPDGPGGSAGLNGGPFGATNQQIEFLEADLSSVDRTITPWVVVGGHRPWYSTGSSSSVCAPCQAAFEPLFYKYGVDLAIFGHVHNSQRFLPANNSVADPNGMNDPKAPLYIVAGGAGNIEVSYLTPDEREICANMLEGTFLCWHKLNLQCICICGRLQLCDCKIREQQQSQG